jgi:cytochrome oxidase Cu insertion factor (SCO1/SenC/PrrC family)
MRPPLRLALAVASAALALILVLAILLGHSSGGHSSGGSPGLSSSTGTKQSNGGFDGAAFPLGVRAPGFTLENQQGRHVSLSALRGRVVVIVFVSTDCRACMLAAQQVRGALDELTEAPTYGRGTAMPATQVLLVSTDPSTDTSARVKRFLANASLATRAQYLTGTLAQLRPVWHAYRVPAMSANRTASEAATTVLLIGPTGAERVGFGLEQLTPESLSHDIRRLQAA